MLNILFSLVVGSGSSGSTSPIIGKAKITVVVDRSTGHDRTVSYLQGDHSSAPFATINSALASLPTTSAYRRLVKINASATSYAGFNASGFQGSGDLVFLFASTAPTLTGLTSGTCGAGTTTTQCSVASGNWGSDTMRQYFISVTNANDSDLPYVRPIKSKTATTLTFDAIPGLANGSTFTIKKTATTLAAASSTYGGYNVGAVVSYNLSPVRMYYAAPAASLDYGVYSTGNALFDGHAFKLANAATYQTVYSNGDLYSTLDDSYASAGSALQQNGGTAELQNVVSDGGYFSLVGVNSALIQLDSASVTAGVPLTVRRSNSVLVGFKGASNTAAEAVLFDSCTSVTLQNAGLTGTSNSAYGAEFTNGGQYAVTGSTITGSSGDFSIDGSTSSTQSWANLATYKAMSRYGGGTLLIGGSGNAEQYILDSLAVGGSNLDVVGAQEQHGGRVINYGFVHLAANTSYDAITAHVGGGCASATAVGLGYTRVGTVGSNGDTVKLNVSTIGGLMQIVENTSASKTLGLCPPTGGNIGGGSTDTAVSVGTSTVAFCISRDDGSGLNYECFTGAKL